MSETRQLFKLLLRKEFYEKHKHKLPVHSFDEIGQELLEILDKAHDTFNHDLTASDLMLAYSAAHPVLTTANRNTVEAYLDNVDAEKDVSEDVADVVYATMWRKEVGRVISQYGFNLANGELVDTDGLTTYLDTVGKGFVPQDFGEPVDTDPVKLFTRINQRGKWAINIPSLNRRIAHVSPGQFIVILARPESGKTATIVNLMAGREGFAAQGAKVHLLANEEGADSTAGRAICCYTQRSFHELRDKPETAVSEEWAKIKDNLVFLHQPEITLAQLDNYCKTNRPDVLIIDQLDHLGIVGSYEKGHERLGAVYRRTREIASKYDMVIIAVSQASAEAENATRVTFAMAEGSKTAKAAAADLIIGIGRADEATGEEGDEVLRHFTVSKNKISGWKGTVIAKLIQSQSRLIP